MVSQALKFGSASCRVSQVRDLGRRALGSRGSEPGSAGCRAVSFGTPASAFQGQAARRLPAPTGAWTGGKMVWRLFSRSSCEISDSICALNSFEARLNSFRARPICRPISGNFLGPNRIRAKRKRKIISGKPRFIELHDTAAANCQQSARCSEFNNWRGSTLCDTASLTGYCRHLAGQNRAILGTQAIWRI